MGYTKVMRIVTQEVRQHACSDFGARLFQIPGIYFDSENAIWYCAVDFCGANTVHFAVRATGGGNGKSVQVEKVPYFVPGVRSGMTTWINPAYVPCPDGSPSHCRCHGCASN